MMSKNLEMQDRQWYGVKRIKYIFAVKGIVEQSVRHLFITLNSFQFLTKY